MHHERALEHKQAGDMAAAIADATMAADLATKADLRELEQRLTIRFGTMLVVAVGILLAGLGATASIILNRLPAPQRTAALVLADERFDWDRYHARQDACREADRIAQDCTTGVAYCDELALRQAKRACSAFGPLGGGRRP